MGLVVALSSISSCAVVAPSFPSRRWLHAKCVTRVPLRKPCMWRRVLFTRARGEIDICLAVLGGIQPTPAPAEYLMCVSFFGCQRRPVNPWAKQTVWHTEQRKCYDYHSSWYHPCETLRLPAKARYIVPQGCRGSCPVTAACGIKRVHPPSLHAAALPAWNCHTVLSMGQWGIDVVCPASML